jgi:hypothetical protein
MMIRNFSLHRTEITARLFSLPLILWCVLLAQNVVVGQTRQGVPPLRQERAADGLDRIVWRTPVIETGFDGSVRTFLMFEGAIYDHGRSLPVLLRNVPVGGSNTLRASLQQTRYEPLTFEERNALGDAAVPSETEVVVNDYMERKQSFARVSIVPLRKNPLSGQLEKLVEFKLVTQEVPQPIMKAAAANGFVTSSQLASGEWYKVAVSKDGIYKVTYEELQQMGMNVAGLDPRRLTVFGNGGGMLPQVNSAFRHDDLVQNPIVVVGDADGSFDPGDHILFYAKGPHSWVRDETVCGKFRHVYNIYDEKAYYFITADRGIAPRVGVQSAPSGQVTHNVNSFVDHQFHEQELSNLIKSGRLWMGELFDIQTTHGVDFGMANVRSGTPTHLGVKVFAKSLTSPTTFSLKVNNNTVATQQVATVSGGYNKQAQEALFCEMLQVGSGNMNVSLTFSKGGNPNAQGWLDYITVVGTRNLMMSGAQMAFRDTAFLGAGNIGEFSIGNASAALRIWETTDPTNVRQMPLSLNGTTATFRVATDSLRQFIAFNGTGYLNVEPMGRVENQNLHALSQADMMIVSHPLFISEANRLAEFHRSNPTNPLSVHVVTPQQVYNEFSSGAQDVTAIRDMMRMFYERSTSWQDMPRYLLLFGDASYDYKDRLASNTNFVPSYQSEESLQPTTSFVSDDYFGLLDPHEGRWNPTDQDALDIGIGRFPVDLSGGGNRNREQDHAL